MKKVVSVSCTVWRSYVEMQASLQFKMLNEIALKFDLKNYVYVDKSVDLEQFKKEQNYEIIVLDYYKRNILLRIFLFFKMLFLNVKNIKKEKPDLVWVFLSAGGLMNSFLFVYKMFWPKKKFFLQTSTPSVNKSKVKRDLQDFMLSVNLRLFRYVGVVGVESLNVRKFRLKKSQICDIKIGMPDYGYKDRLFDEINLVYIGTLNTRNIWQAVDGFSLFVGRNQNIPCSLHIIGGGGQNEINRLEQSIKQSNYPDKITYHGQLSVEEVVSVFNICNVGLAYVPINNYFQNSSTKTAEFALCGMPIIATANNVRSKMVTDEIGVLCQDNPKSFAEALEVMWYNLQQNKYSSKQIRAKFESCSISYSMSNYYIPILKDIIS